jgi:hypothetical protein
LPVSVRSSGTLPVFVTSTANFAFLPAVMSLGVSPSLALMTGATSSWRLATATSSCWNVDATSMGTTCEPAAKSSGTRNETVSGPPDSGNSDRVDGDWTPSNG